MKNFKSKSLVLLLGVLCSVIFTSCDKREGFSDLTCIIINQDDSLYVNKGETYMRKYYDDRPIGNKIK